MAKEKIIQFGQLEAKYNFALNPFPKSRFSKCPVCEGKTGQRKVPLFIHVEPQYPVSLNYTNRYCPRCDLLIAHKHEIEHLLTDLFTKRNPSIIGNRYYIIGTVEKKAWREGVNNSISISDILSHVHDFKGHMEIHMSIGGWVHKDDTPPEMPPPPSTEWVK
ncbi:MAG: hypothetical protein P9L92_06655 [Candidatus Electryonea clarkiae]|nr:hypothetical protein [Candidatus Electryonea clarkiae]MDP8287877.1 hypothetical protein [Candidatus Electryonea clarkiae]